LPLQSAGIRRFSRRKPARLALDLSGHALVYSALEVLRAIMASLGPGIWLDRTGHARIAEDGSNWWRWPAHSNYAREHAEIFVPMQRLFAQTREIGTASMHEVGAFG
jgi:hypothetical protein